MSGWRLILVVFALILVFDVCANSSFSNSMITVGSLRLQVHVEGKGIPAVVIDSGIAVEMDTLKSFRERIAKFTQVITYNRAGYGQSEPGPLPRDGAREAEELKKLLQKSSVPGPYILVGHSLGALNVMIFASKYPKDVAGLVLLDPPPLTFVLGKEYRELGVMMEKMTLEWQGIADSMAKSNNEKDRVRSSFFRMIASEHREMVKTAKMVDAISTFGSIPLIVIASGKPNPAFGQDAEKFQQYWVDQSRLLTRKSTKSNFIYAEKSTHFLYVDVPDRVEESIRSLVNGIRKKYRNSSFKNRASVSPFSFHATLHFFCLSLFPL